MESEINKFSGANEEESSAGQILVTPLSRATQPDQRLGRWILGKRAIYNPQSVENGKTFVT